MGDMAEDTTVVMDTEMDMVTAGDMEVDTEATEDYTEVDTVMEGTRSRNTSPLRDK